MFRHIRLFAALVLLLAVPTAAHATPVISLFSLDKTFVPCTGGTTSSRAINATATTTGTTSSYRIRWSITGPNPDSDGAILNYSPGNGGIIGSDLADSVTRIVNCNEWGYYTVKAELLPPLGQGDNVLSTATDVYEATYRAALDAFTVDTFTQNGCSSFTVGITLKDQDARLVKGMPVVFEASTQSGSTGIASGTTGTTISTAGKVTLTIPMSPAMHNGGAILELKHVVGTGAGQNNDFLDPFFYFEIFSNVVGCP